MKEDLIKDWWTGHVCGRSISLPRTRTGDKAAEV